MNAPEGGIAYVAQPTIAVASIVVSKTNPRKTFDKVKHQELTDSVKLKGVINPILVRPLNKANTFEVVAGERRFKAAVAAGLSEIPATIKTLTDAEALELQVIENNQREDLHPLEEAEGYEALLKCKHENGMKYSVDDIAAKVGKSKSYVYQKLKLCACCPEVRKAFYDDKVDFSKALLLARIPSHNQQREALKLISQPRFTGGEAMSFREAQRHVHQNYMLALDKAPFPIKDESLVAKVGACTTCPKRTGNAPDLFPDVKSGDVCTDSECFGKKRDAALDRKREEAIAAGQHVITGKAAKEIMPSEFGGLQGGFVKLDEKCWDDPKQRTYGELVGKAVKPSVLEDPHRGNLIEVVKLSDVKPILKEKGAVKERVASTSRSPGRADHDEKLALRKRIFMHVCAALPKKLGEVEIRWIVDELTNGDADFELLEEIFFPGAKGKKSPGTSQFRIASAVPKLDAENLTRLVVAMVLSNEATNAYLDDKRLAAAAKVYGVDVAGVKAALKSEAAEKAKAAAEATKGKKSAKPKKAKKGKK
jgi:ParB/RepB/Spo0J family partition protein